jgi:hypothetical protein
METEVRELLPSAVGSRPSDEKFDRIFEELPEEFEANSPEEGAEGVKNGPR